MKTLKPEGVLCSELKTKQTRGKNNLKSKRGVMDFFLLQVVLENLDSRFQGYILRVLREMLSKLCWGVGGRLTRSRD